MIGLSGVIGISVIRVSEWCDRGVNGVIGMGVMCDRYG